VLPAALRPATAKAARARAQAVAGSGWPDDPSELRKSRKRTAELACVADIAPAPRTVEDILAALFSTGSAPAVAGEGGRTGTSALALNHSCLIADSLTWQGQSSYALCRGRGHPMRSHKRLAGGSFRFLHCADTRYHWVSRVVMIQFIGRELFRSDPCQ
jgi:hypothetical protein